jgi:hypothetical protein
MRVSRAVVIKKGARRQVKKVPGEKKAKKKAFSLFPLLSGDWVTSWVAGARYVPAF